ncbi:H-type lectin domain-containing protein [Alteromonas sp. S167]|uniref:H-type lectin domain-containing protein n=1 Tax=Alteromonas sp. S167 TaxID=3117402 RepID=UPI002FE26C2F
MRFISPVQLVVFAIAVFVSRMLFAVPQIEGRFIELQNTYNKAEWTTISFSQVYDEPPAVFMLSTNQGNNPAIVKIRNVTRTGFEALPLEPSGEDGPHITMGGHYLAIAYGVHEFPNGDIVEVGKMNVGSNAVQASPNSPWFGTPELSGSDESRYVQVPLITDFGEQPVFFHSLQTVNNQVDVNGKTPPNTYLLPFLTVAAKYDNVGSNLVPPVPQLNEAYFIALEASETFYQEVTRNETIAYMATTAGSGRSFFDDNGLQVEWEAHFAETLIEGWDDGCFRNDFKNKYNQTPLVAASKITRNGQDGGWLRSCGINNNRIGLRVDEDRSLDSERNHTAEEASIIAMTSEFVFSGDLPSCDVAFPGALATFNGSTVYLGSNSRIFDENNGVLTTIDVISDVNKSDPNFPKCGENAVACFPSNTDALSASQVRAIPTISIDDSGPELEAGDLAGDYFFSRKVVTMAAGAYTVKAPTRIYVSDPGGVVNTSTIFSMVNASITVENGAYLAIYVDGDVIIDGTNPNAIIIATGNISFVNVTGETISGRFTAGGGVTANAAVSVLANEVPNNIPGICGRDVIEVLNHYRFEMADNLGSSCAAKEVTLKACADVNCDLLYSQEATVNLVPTNGNDYVWSPGDSVNFIGQTSLTIESLRGKDPTLATSGETPSSQLRCFIGGSEVALNSCKINFKSDGLVFSNISDGNETIVTQLSGKPSDAGFNAKTYAIEACGNTDLLRNQTVDVELNYNCASSSNCSNSLVFSNNNSDTEIGLSATTVPVYFDDDSRALFSVQYPDAGEISLTAELSERSSIAGSSNIFKVRPFGIAVEVLDDTGTNINPNATAANANGSLLKLTGQDFVVGLRTVQWVAGEDGDSDGVPDDFTSLLNNNTAEHFSGTVELTPTTLLPASGVTGSLSGGTSVVFTDEGKVNTTVDYDEVGVININASSNYLSSTTVQGQMSNVGRFAPSNFILSGDVTPACDVASAFTYFDEPLDSVSYTLQAVNQNGAKTVNYFGGFDKLNANNMQMEHSGSVYNRLVNVDSVTWPQSGVTGRIDFTDTDIAVSRLADASLDGAYMGASLILELDSAQLEGATFNGSYCTPPCLAFIESSLNFAYGRATLTNNYGSVDESLLLPMTTQYWDGNDWRINMADSCSTFDHNDIDESTGQLVSSQTGSTLSQGAYAGREGMRLSSPNGEGNFSVTYEVPQWLRWDWDQDGDADESPSATVTFGVYRGNDDIIYKRERVGND